jgi:hypothetical protein
MIDEEKLSKQGRVPIKIRFVSLFYPVVDYIKKYGEDGRGTLNESKGEIFKFSFHDGHQKINIGKQVVGLSDDSKGEYNGIWKHLGGYWFKLISKVR